MHEFSLCQNVVSIVSKSISNEHKKPTKIIIEIGELAGVDVESFSFWFPVATADTILCDTKLELTHQAGKAHCNECLQEFKINKLYQPCPNCGGFDKEIIQGKNMLIKSVIFD